MGALEERMVDYAAALRIGDLPAAVAHQAKRRVIDTIGCALAAYAAPPVEIARGQRRLPRLGQPGADDARSRRLR
jgi:2-methylcitrate dehydratase